MKQIRAVMMALQGPPIKLAITAPKELPQVAQQILGCKKPLVQTRTKLGVILHPPVVSEEEEKQKPRNHVATRLHVKFANQEYSDLPHEGVVRGPCLLVNEEKGEFKNVDKTHVTEVNTAYAEVTGETVIGRKYRDPREPKHWPSANNLFHREYNRTRRAELSNSQKQYSTDEIFALVNQESQQLFSQMSEEEKRPYREAEEKAKAEYQAQLAAYRQEHPLPPKNKRTAFNMYCKQNSNTANRRPWNSLTADEKKPYEQASEADRPRYEAEWAVYEAYCRRNGLPCAKRKMVMKAKTPAKSKRKRVAEKTSKPKKRRAVGAVKKTKKTKA